MSREGRMDTVDLGMPSVRPQHASPSSHLRGERGFPSAARDELGNETLRGNLRHATTTLTGGTTHRGKTVPFSELKQRLEGGK